MRGEVGKLNAYDYTSLLMSLFFRQPLEIEIKFDNEESREIVDTKPRHGNSAHKLTPLYAQNETVSGSVILRPRDGRRVEHNGVKVRFVGAIEQLHKEKVIDSNDFMSWTHELSGPDELRNAETLNFEFKNVEKQYESYQGMKIRLRYYVQVTVYTRSSECTQDRDLWVYHYTPVPTNQHVVTLDIGIENCLHIEFEYAKSHFSLTDTIVGRIFFLVVRLKLKTMEISLIRKETSGIGSNTVNESEVIVRYETMDGTPVRGEQIPIRMHLSGYDLVPTMKDINKKFSVRTYLSLVLIDESGRRYFKQSELFLYREDPKSELEM